MPHIPNRSAFVLIPEAPMLAWVQLISAEDYTMDALFDEAEVYLVPSFNTDDEFDAVLEAYWPRLFEAELGAWTKDAELWPRDRTMDKFLEWFKFTPFSGVHDLGVEPMARVRD